MTSAEKQLFIECGYGSHIPLQDKFDKEWELGKTAKHSLGEIIKFSDYELMVCSRSYHKKSKNWSYLLYKKGYKPIIMDECKGYTLFMWC